MHYRFEFRPYRRQFKRPLHTSHGIWEVREGIILRLTDEIGRVGWGEIAPLSWFGSETFEEAGDFCRQLGDEITEEVIFSIPNALPACQFGFESAWEWTNHGGAEESKTSLIVPPISLTYSGLLPAGEAALHEWQTLWQQGYHTFKWKIGVAAIDEELTIFYQLIAALPTGTKLRLDANGGLSWQQAKAWLEACEGISVVEFLEQPLGVNQFDEMLALSSQYSTQLALDESVANIEQLETCYQLGWRGVFVIKACIAGSPSHLRQFCQQHEIDAVFSSVFETAIGRQAALNLAAELSHPKRAVGFGVNHWFDEDKETWEERLWKDC